MSQDPSSTPEPRDAEGRRLGERLRAVRDYLNLSQQYVADRTGIPRSAISDIERGTRRVDSIELKKLARLYSVTVDYLLSDEAEPDAGEHAIAGMARLLTGLTEGDRQQVVQFAKFLRLQQAGRREASEDRQDDAL